MYDLFKSMLTDSLAGAGGGHGRTTVSVVLPTDAPLTLQPRMRGMPSS